MIEADLLRILHEYEITDADGRHFASIVYLRKYTEENNEKNDLRDVIDIIMERNISNCKGCRLLRKLSPRLIFHQSDVDELNKRLLNEFQLKGYFTFFASSDIKGGIPTDFSRITIHTSILVKKETDVRCFENIGIQENVGDTGEICRFALSHFRSPVYLLQEHPLVHGIVCFKDAAKKDVVYFLYRHNNNPTESILAEVDTVNKTVQLKQGTNNAQSDAIIRFASSIVAQNYLLPFYNYDFITDIAPIYVTRLQLNRERGLFKIAKDIVCSELAKNDSSSFKEMKMYLATMIEA